MASDEQARHWLRSNGYDDIADKIDAIMDEWRAAGKKTRRNWWELLAGGKGGRPRRIAGREFSVLRSAQIREGLPVTKNAIRRRPNEKPPP